jgi:hypothetical protein
VVVYIIKEREVQDALVDTANDEPKEIKIEVGGRLV